MTNTAEQLEIEEVPSGGIGDFVMSEEDFRVLERQNAAEEYGNEGIARFEDTASRIAAYGRFGDDQVAHVETGELIVPRQLIDQSTELKNSIFQHLREAGIEDPERYVVGNAENSINPETGLMEFGFFSKIFKGIKKAFKKIGKVLKKAAPIILSVALAGPLGAVYGGMVGQGIGTLIQGGSIKDAFKAAAIGGLTGAAFSGIGGAIDPNQTALGAIQESLANPGLRFSQAGANIGEVLRGEAAKSAGGEGVLKTLTRRFEAPVRDIAGATDLIEGEAARNLDEALQGRLQTADGAVDSNLTRGTTTSIEELGTNRDAILKTPTELANEEYYRNKILEGTPSNRITIPEKTSVSDEIFNERAKALQDAGLGVDGLPIAVKEASTVPSVAADATRKGLEALAETGSGTALENIKEMLDFGQFGSEKTFLEAGKDLFFPKVGTLTDYYEAAGIDPSSLSGAAAETAKEQGLQFLADKGLRPGLLRRFGPGIATLAVGSGAFEEPPMEEAGLVERDEQGNILRGDDYLAADPFRFRIFPTGFQPSYRPPVNPIVPYSPQLVAEGGEIFPRRTGGIMPDEGIPNEDSVKAMLMPGEFVMTTTAVRGAGDGDLNKGINNMYSVMRNLEARGRAMS